MVEVLVLGREEGRLHPVRDRLDRQIEPPLVRIFGDQLAVGRVDAGHDRRFVFGEHLEVRQILRQTRNVPGDCTSDEQEEHSAYPEKVAEDPKYHSPRSPRPVLNPSRGAALTLRTPSV